MCKKKTCVRGLACKHLKLYVVVSSLCGSVQLTLYTAQRPRGKTMMVPCDTEYPAFVSERTIKETTGNIECDGCMRYF